MRDAVMTAEELSAYLAAEFPQAMYPGSGLTIEAVWHKGCRVRQDYQARLIRPGGTISGPAMMTLADFTFYVALLGVIGRVPLAVTINLNINFLRKPAQAALIAEARLLKVGKRLAVGEVAIRSDGEEDPVAHVTATYSIPPRNGDA
jgi:uncharacterized protein (TIGR00369 family)